MLLPQKMRLWVFLFLWHKPLLLAHQMKSRAMLFWQVPATNVTALGILTTCKPLLPRHLWPSTKCHSLLGCWSRCARKQLTRCCHCATGCPSLLQSLCLHTISSPKICTRLYVAALWPWLWAWTMSSRLWVQQYQILQSSQLITSRQPQTACSGTKQNLGKYFK